MISEQKPSSLFLVKVLVEWKKEREREREGSKIYEPLRCKCSSGTHFSSITLQRSRRGIDLDATVAGTQGFELKTVLWLCKWFGVRKGPTIHNRMRGPARGDVVGPFRSPQLWMSLCSLDLGTSLRGCNPTSYLLTMNKTKSTLGNHGLTYQPTYLPTNLPTYLPT